MNEFDRIGDLSQLWKQAAVVFPYFDRVALDWDQTYRAFLPRAAAAEDEAEFHLLMAEFLNLLGDGHTDYLLPRRLTEERGQLPFSLGYLGDGYFVDGIAKGGEKHLLTKVTGINGKPMDSILGEAFRYCYHVDRFIYPSRLRQILPFLLKPEGNVLETEAGAYVFDLCREKPELLRPEEPEADRSWKSLTRGKLYIRMYEGNILYIRLDDFLYARAAEEAAGTLERAGDLKGVILDLRKNIGGMTYFGGKVAELFIPGEFHGSGKWTRTFKGIDMASAGQVLRMSKQELDDFGGEDPVELETCRRIMGNVLFEEYRDTYGSPDHRAAYGGPCVVLTSRNTISAAEDIVAMFRTNRRAAIIGAPTCGTTGTPLLLNLSCGGRARICSVGYRLLDGTEFIRRGIQPDILAENTLEDLKNGYDRVLERGFREIIGG